jgi:hypothetical protein
VLSAALALVQVFLSVTAGLDATFELVIKAGAAGAAAAACWKWMAGPCWRSARDAFEWVKVHLEVLEHVRPEIRQVREELAEVHDQLRRGEEHFQQIDAVIEVLQADERRVIHDALVRGESIPLTPDGGVDRRRDPSDV